MYNDQSEMGEKKDEKSVNNDEAKHCVVIQIYNKHNLQIFAKNI